MLMMKKKIKINSRTKKNIRGGGMIQSRQTFNKNTKQNTNQNTKIKLNPINNRLLKNTANSKRSLYNSFRKSLINKNEKGLCKFNDEKLNYKFGMKSINLDNKKFNFYIIKSIDISMGSSNPKIENIVYNESLLVKEFTSDKTAEFNNEVDIYENIINVLNLKKVTPHCNYLIDSKECRKKIQFTKTHKFTNLVKKGLTKIANVFRKEKANSYIITNIFDIKEKEKYVTLSQFLDYKVNISLNEIDLIYIIMQITYTLKCFVAKGINHNQCTCNNILINKSRDFENNSFDSYQVIKYIYDDYTDLNEKDDFTIPDYGLRTYIINFEKTTKPNTSNLNYNNEDIIIFYNDIYKRIVNRIKIINNKEKCENELKILQILMNVLILNNENKIIIKSRYNKQIPININDFNNTDLLFDIISQKQNNDNLTSKYKNSSLFLLHFFMLNCNKENVRKDYSYQFNSNKEIMKKIKNVLNSKNLLQHNIMSLEIYNINNKLFSS